MQSILNKARISSALGGRPPAAIEITPEGVLAASRPSVTGEPQFAFVPLAEGAVVTGIDEPNLRAPEAVANAIRSALDQLSLQSRYISVVLPDPSVRVFVLDFDSLPPKASEALPILRFRLRKMVHFDVDHAGLSYQILTENRDECKVLAAIIPGPILAEYETAARGAGFEPGAVLPASLAALEATESMEAVLTANLTQRALTTTIANGQDLLLYRTIELPADKEIRITEIQRGIAVASAFFEDKLSAKPRRLYYAGNQPSAEFAGWINDWIKEAELSVVELAPMPKVGVLNSLGNANIAGVCGALALRGQQAGAR